MHPNSLLICFFVLFTVKLGWSFNFFGYSLEDQLRWPINFPACAGRRQSPIALRGITPRPSNRTLLILRGYNDKLPRLRVFNNGLTVTLALDTNAVNSGTRIPYITGDILKHRYQFDSIHLHWGITNSIGSEHIINDIQAPLELHIVHKLMTESRKRKPRQTNEYAVLGIKYKLAKKSGRYLEPIINNVARVEQFNSTIFLEGSYTLGSFLSNINRRKFYNYEGSFTIPPCTENIAWFVFRDLLSCTASQLAQLRRLESFDRNGNPSRLLETNRVVQPLNNRRVNFYADRRCPRRRA